MFHNYFMFNPFKIVSHKAIIECKQKMSFHTQHPFFKIKLYFIPTNILQTEIE